jgi:hypothetical protein
MRAALIYSLFLVFLTLGQTTLADEAKDSTDSSTPTENRFGAQGSLSFGLGTGSNNSGSIPSRAMNILSLRALPGYRLGRWMPGLYLDYHFVGQTAEPSSVSNQNLGGAGYLVGLGGTFDWNKFNFLLAVNFYGSYTLSTQAFGGQTSVYSAPLGFVAMANYQVLKNYPDWLAGLFVQSTAYSTSTLGGTSVDVSSNKLTLTFYGLNASYHY